MCGSSLFACAGHGGAGEPAGFGGGCARAAAALQQQRGSVQDGRQVWAPSHSLPRASAQMFSHVGILSRSIIAPLKSTVACAPVVCQVLHGVLRWGVVLTVQHLPWRHDSPTSRAIALHLACKRQAWTSLSLGP